MPTLSVLHSFCEQTLDKAKLFRDCCLRGGWLYSSPGKNLRWKAGKVDIPEVTPPEKKVFSLL